MVMSETYEGLHGLTCTHTYSKVNEFPYENRWEFRCGDNTAIVIVDDMGQPASLWTQSAPATLVTRRRGEVSSRPRKFTVFGQAEREALKFCHDSSSDMIADLELTNLTFAKNVGYTSRFHEFMAGRLVDQERMNRLVKEATGIDLEDPDTEELNFKVAGEYVDSMVVEELQKLVWERTSLLSSIDRFVLIGDHDGVDRANVELAELDHKIDEMEERVVHELGAFQQPASPAGATAPAAGEAVAAGAQ
ncbi:hypothetical protein [Bifidobacterium choloepi]|uniref:Uncharacterized protein n=1 Tax=Bifidobacterium choloepi TaxID=2614131 RepID=A0A6I5MZA3_9BIFI|nr:hypothetical protein [Bifidobacterium choloepi]NEG69155.1 hypothetical protein [Bifidobacterium choloepi]